MSESTGPQRVWSWLRSPAARRWLALLTVSIGTAALSMEYRPQSTDDFKVGDVADRSVKANNSFPLTDWEATLSRQRKAEASVLPVYDFDATLAARVNTRIGGAFETARLRHSEALAKDPAGVPPEVLALRWSRARPPLQRAHAVGEAPLLCRQRTPPRVGVP